MLRSPICWLLCTFCLAVPPHPAAAATANPDDAWFQSLQWREIGPYRGGRSAAVTGIPADPGVYCFGATGGGVWKTADGGNSWRGASWQAISGDLTRDDKSKMGPSGGPITKDEPGGGTGNRWRREALRTVTRS